MKKPLKICAAALIFSTSCSTYAYDWSGAYAGGSLGYAQADDTAIAYDDGDTTPNDWTADVSLNGSALGVFGGYNWVRDNGVLFGIEAEYQHRMSHDGRAFEKKGGVTDTLFALNTEITAVASLKARAGRIFNKQKTLAYVSAGLAKAKIERTWLDFDYSESESHSNWQSGWTAGVGVEHKYNDNFSVRAELMHSDYGNQTVDASQWDEYYSTDLTENSLILGFSYSF